MNTVKSISFTPMNESKSGCQTQKRITDEFKYAVVKDFSEIAEAYGNRGGRNRCENNIARWYMLKRGRSSESQVITFPKAWLDDTLLSKGDKVTFNTVKTGLGIYLCIKKANDYQRGWALTQVKESSLNMHIQFTSRKEMLEVGDLIIDLPVIFPCENVIRWNELDGPTFGDIVIKIPTANIRKRGIMR